MAWAPCPPKGESWEGYAGMTEQWAREHSCNLTLPSSPLGPPRQSWCSTFHRWLLAVGLQLRSSSSWPHSHPPHYYCYYFTGA